MVTPSRRLLLREGALGTLKPASLRPRVVWHTARGHTARRGANTTPVPVLAPELRVLGLREEPHRPVLSPLGVPPGSPRPRLPVGWALAFPAEIQHHSTTPGSGRSASLGCHTNSWMQASENMAARQDSLQPEEMGSLASKGALTKAVSQPKHIHHAESAGPSLRQGSVSLPHNPFLCLQGIRLLHISRSGRRARLKVTRVQEGKGRRVSGFPAPAQAQHPPSCVCHMGLGTDPTSLLTGP